MGLREAKLQENGESYYTAELHALYSSCNLIKNLKL